MGFVCLFVCLVGWLVDFFLFLEFFFCSHGLCRKSWQCQHMSEEIIQLSITLMEEEETWIKVHRWRPRTFLSSTTCNEDFFVSSLPLSNDTTYESINILSHLHVNILMILLPLDCLQRHLYRFASLNNLFMQLTRASKFKLNYDLFLDTYNLHKSVT